MKKPQKSKHRNAVHEKRTLNITFW